MLENLNKRISLLEKKIADISHQLSLVLKYIKSDPNSSLNKCRTILEKLLLQVYRCEMGTDPKKYEIGTMLKNNQFTGKLERRIVSRMDSIRDMGNLGTHGEYVEFIDAKRAFEDLLIKEVLNNG